MPDFRGFDRLTGHAFASRSEVIAPHAMAATSHPLATQVALQAMRSGGSAVDGAIAANAALGLMEPTGGGIGGDLFALVWDPDARLQIRVRARIALGPGTAPDWAALPDASRTLYGGTPPPGAPIPTPAPHRAAPDPARFMILTATIHEMETLRLADPHERARFSRSDGFAGTWIAP